MPRSWNRRECSPRLIPRYAPWDCRPSVVYCLSDTVGFIRNLPHTLVSAFRATLEEVQRATLVLQVSDASNPLSAEQDAQVDKVLKELEADGKPRLRVMNKIDLLPAGEREALQNNERTVYVSASEGNRRRRPSRAYRSTCLRTDRPSRVSLKVPQKGRQTTR